MASTSENYTGDDVLDGKITEWMNWNKNEKMAKEAKAILEKKDKKELTGLFLDRLEFGTAGLRGAMGPGYSCMNHLVVLQTAQGLLRYLEKTDPLIKKRGLVIGYDGRHNSYDFAELSANIFVRNDVPVYLFSKMCPTPFVPFSVIHFAASAGIMVTASHNPKQDNGYKVYWNNGSQIIPPVDKGIATSILENLEPWPGVWETEFLLDNSLLRDPLEEASIAYTGHIISCISDPLANRNCPIDMTYTAMHGVGYPFIKDAFKAAGFKDLIPVEEQIEPDPEFPTVVFPNPEEGKSALELSIKTADEHSSPLILANDPDADRLAVAEKSKEGKWKIFTGNELGGLIGWWEMKTFKDGKGKGSNLSDVYMLSSTVSSKIVKSICTQEGLSFEETLTGFKWMGNKTQELVGKGKTVLFAFEEAIGFMCSSVVPDKDGVSAAVRVAELAAHLYSKGQTLQSHLDYIYSKYGFHVSKNSYFICHEPPVINKIFDRLRNFQGEPNTYHESLGIWKVVSVRDLTTGYDSSKPDKKATLPTSASSQMITYAFDNGFVTTLRTSGTEPKVKYYTELCASPDMKDLNVIKKTLDEMVTMLVEEMLQPKENKLLWRKGE